MEYLYYLAFTVVVGAIACALSMDDEECIEVTLWSMILAPLAAVGLLVFGVAWLLRQAFKKVSA